MKHIISLSGGIGSYFTLKRVIESGVDKKDIELIFCDTLNENGDLYRFLDDIENKFDLKITRLCAGKTPFELAWEDNFLYNSRVANCSKKLKSKLFKEYIKKYDEATIYFGIDFTESHRCKAIIKNYKDYICEFPLCKPPYIYKFEMIELLKQDGIKVPYMYEKGFSHNNCNGLCFKAGIKHFKLLLETDRNKYLEFENMEQMLIKKIGKEVGIMKKQGKPYTLRQLRESVDNDMQLSFDEFEDIGGCGCFVDE